MNVKQLTAIILSCTMLFGTAACSSKEESTPVTQTQDLIMLKSAKIDMSDDFSRIINLDRNSSGSILIFGELKNGGYAGYVTDSEFSDHEEFRLTPEEDENIKSAVLLPFGKKAVLSYADGSTHIRIFGSDNTEQSVLDCGEILEDGEEYAQILSYGSDGYIIRTIDGRLAAVSSDGKYRGDISTGGKTVYGTSRSTEDIVTCLLMDGDKLSSAEIDAENLSLVNEKSCGTQNSSPITICAGMGEYEFAAVFMDGLYGLKDGNWVKICDFLDNDFSAYDVTGIIMTTENEYATIIYSGSGTCLELLTERDVSELKSKKVIRVAKLGHDVEEMAKYYNSTHEDGEYRVELVDYVTNDNGKAYDALKMDIISGNSPDVIFFNYLMPIDIFGSPDSIFVDMYTLMENDPDLSREDFLPNALEGLERDGKLIQITPSFGFSTVIAVNDYVKEGWTYDDLMSAYLNLPDDCYIFDHLDETPMIGNFQNFLRYDQFVDYDNAKCDFDNDTFIKYMKFFKENKIGLTFEEYEAIAVHDSWEEPSGTPVVSTNGFMNFWQIHSTVNGQFRDFDVSFIGYPYLNGIGGNYVYYPMPTMGIMANSPNIDGAWDFIKEFFTDYYYDGAGLSDFPILADLFEERCNQTTRDHTYIDDDGKEVTKKWTYQNNYTWESTDIENFTQEECDFYKDMIKSAKAYNSYDHNVQDILWEEAGNYFEGECTAEEAAAMIQNRVSIYLSEQYG